MHQISNYVYALDDLLEWDIPTKRLPNPYHDFPYILISGVLTSQECEEIISLVQDASQKHTASLRGGDTNADVRKTDIYTLPPKYTSLYQMRFDLLRPLIEDFFALLLTYSTPLQVLGYEEGAFYVKHADDSSELRNRDGDTVGYVCVAPERKLSSVLFCNDTFEGGELLFNYLYDDQDRPIKVQPKAGDMLVFLSNPYFAHEVLPVTQGFRLSIVQWHDALL
ncbi:MAG: 2OG-Fe(II) oxygenase [Sulfuricurvum sp.]|nr:2OG-Fe(II) oxygenase [Sulfuricurvum sp.]